ncbi:MAG: hypothetical protein WBN31_11925 [Gammaproteobacteria bacterium]
MLNKICLSSCLLLVSLVFQNAGAADAEEAGRFYQAQQWPQAVVAYEAVVAEQPENAQAQFRLATGLRHVGRFQDAGEHLELALAAGIPAQFVDIERARLAVATGQPELAVAALSNAAQAGFSNPSSITDDPAMEPLSSVAGFQASLDQMKRNAAPCEYDPVFRQFDFWVGAWEVKGSDGTFYGNNRISSEEQGCVLVERWSSATGSTGMSINYYDANTREWVQIWNGLGIQIQYRGGLQGESMVLTGGIHYLTSGDQRDFRGTWTPMDDGVVRQFFEESTDGGETWNTWFDGYYHPLAAGKAADDGS